MTWQHYAETGSHTLFSNNIKEVQIAESYNSWYTQTQQSKINFLQNLLFTAHIKVTTHFAHEGPLKTNHKTFSPRLTLESNAGHLG